MSHQELIDMTRSLVEHGAADTMEYADEVVRIPASSYTDPELFEREKKQIFRRLPLMVAPSCELPKPGDYKAKIEEVANAPGEEIMPGDLGRALEILKEGGEIDYVGASAVELIGAGESAGSYREIEMKDGKMETVGYR